jgi:shikimate kinase
MKVYLIGMPGSGKSTLGKQLAEKLSVDFVDLDQEIEKEAGKAVPEIFLQQGEDQFRKIESDLLNRWAASSKSYVMATGGGAPCFFHGIETINQSGLSIFLDVSVDEIVRRLSSFEDRPLLHSKNELEKKEKLKTLLDSRAAIYRKAAITVKTTSVRDLVDVIRTKMNIRR